MLRRYRPAFQALFAAVLFGASAPLAKLLLGEMEPVPLASFLYLGSGLGAFLMFFFQNFKNGGRLVEANLNRQDLPWLGGAILAGGIGAPILLLMGLERTPASTASLLLNFESVATTLIAISFFKESPTITHSSGFSFSFFKAYKKGFLLGFLNLVSSKVMT